jgi:signal transduction histidine kinase
MDRTLSQPTDLDGDRDQDPGRDLAVGQQAASEARGVEDAMQALSRVSVELLDSYRKLAERAERMEGELGRTNAELERILESLPTGVVVRDAAGRVVRTNRALRSILGLAPGELERLGTHAALAAVDDEWVERELSHPDGRPLVLATVRSPFASGASGLSADGDGDDRGGEDGSVQIVEDRTELARLSQRIHALDKLASLGNMAGGIAHELRNPMNAVRGFAALLLPRLPADSKEREWAQLIVEGVDEADAILSSMLTIAAPEALAREGVDGAELLEEAAAMALRDALAEPDAAPEGWTLTCTADLPRFEGDRIKLRQALRNLITNALQARPAGGEVRATAALEGGQVLLRVADAGPGIAPELCGRVLDPVFTTRAQGTGLGLALVGTIAQLHGGRVDVSRASAPLGGADVSIRIPFKPAD